MRTALIRLVAIAGLLAARPLSSQQPAGAASQPSLDRPCSFITATDLSAMLSTPVAGATDEHFRCKYTIGKGWLETKLMNLELKASRDIFDYNKAHGKLVPGVGDQAYQLGATLAAKVGDVLVVVDGSNAPRSANDAQIKAVALKIIRAIP